jgi:ribosomal protein S18 acetylase RimI-like enzyme
VLRFKYRINFQTVNQLCPTSRTEVEQIVACVFMKAIDCCVQKALPSAPSATQVPEDGPMLQICNVRALSVLSDHRRQWIASSLLRHLKKD